ncbi:hypothetical protein MMC08_001126 [Hypocenomyce scalaris]|nr:hypothetical protein [Hypocenomyce scalaris]
MLCESGQQLLHGFSTDGFFAQYAVVDHRAATIVPFSLDLRTSSPIFCAGLTAYNSVSNCDLQPGQWLGVLGCGGLGQMATQYAKAMGLKVVGLDINDSGLAAVRELGADATFNTKSDAKYLEKLKQLTAGGLHGLVFVTNAHAAFAPALQTLRINGIMMVTGIPAQDLPINAMDLVTGRYRIKGGTTGVPHQMAEAVEFTAKHGIVPKVVFYRLDEINTMVERMKRGEVGEGRMGVDFSTEARL